MIHLFRTAWSQLRAAFRKEELDREFGDELAAHLELLTEENRQRGLPEGQARRQALLKLGGLEPARELHRDTRGLPLLDTLVQDLRYTFRTMRRDAGFTIFAILIVGLGIGACATVFSVVNSLLIRPLPFREPGRLVWLSNNQGEGLSAQTMQVSNYQDLREHNRSFSDLAAYFAFYGVGDNNLIGQGEPERLSGVPVSGNFFDLLGVRPQIGRLFTPEECKWNGPGAVLLSHGLWRRRFNSDPRIVGQSLNLNGGPVTVTGVLPASFDFSSVFAPASHIDLVFPFPISPETDRWGNTLAVIGRLKPGVNVSTAQAEATLITGQFNRAHRGQNSWIPKLTFLQEHVSGRLRSALVVLACAVGVVMLIVCANLSNLLLARMAARQKEIAIRAALGAGRWRLIRQMLTESVVLSCCGAVLGLLFAVAGTRLVSSLQSISIPLLGDVRVDASALGFTLLAAVLTGIIFGIVPALQVPRVAVHDTLKDASRGSSEGRGRTWIRSTLVVSEIAFACILLVGAGLLIRSFLRVLDVDMGFQPARAAAVRVDPDSRNSTPARRNAYFDEVLRLAKSVPGIQAAGLTDALPLGRNRSWGVQAKGHLSPEGQNPDAFVRIVSDGYLKAMGIPLRAGRDLSPRDTQDVEKVILVNETMARTLWPGEDALGQKMTADIERRVVGIAGDVRHLALEQGSGMEMYLPIRQTGDYASVDLVLRTTLPPSALASAVRAALSPIAPNLPPSDFRTLQQLVDKSVSPRRFVVFLLAGFASLALILASLGIYAVISYSVNQRTQEIGIRMALGASAGNVQLAIIRQTLALALTGIVFGSAGAWVLARSLRSLLFGVTPADPATFLAMLALLGAVALAAGYLPARRASRIDPMSALRAS